jgi:xylulokinase
MTQDCLLGLDIGTQGVKGVVVTTDGRLLARAQCNHHTRQPLPGWSEQDPEKDWWGDGLTIISRLLSQAGIEAARIAAVGVTGLTPCLSLVGNDGHPSRPAILYNDNRALDQLARVNQVLDTIGSAKSMLTAQAITPKWLWLAEQEPDVLAEARAILSSYNYVVYRLTGTLSLDYDTASIVGGVFDNAHHGWDYALCTHLGLDARLLPSPRPATDIAGGVTEEAARATGLRPGTPVIVGTGDTFASLLGCGAVDEGDAAIILGTTGLLTLTPHPLEIVAGGPHFEGSTPNVGVTWVANLLASGQVQTWFRAELASALESVRPACPQGQGEASDAYYTLLDQEAGRIAPGSERLIALPHWLGRRTPTPDPNARGVLFGLTNTHTPAHIYRALLESVGYAFRQGFDEVRPRVRRVIATAGGAASLLLRQIIADVLEVPIAYHPHSSGALGIAFLAGHATQYLTDFRAIKTAWLVDPVVVKPQPAAIEIYRQLYPVYCHLDRSLEPAFAMLQLGGAQTDDN